jgi:RHS repeat-associated protein
MEKDDEVHNVEGSSYDFGARMYNSRIARFFSTDPREVEYPWSSPYNYAAGGSPLFYIDFNGEGRIVVVGSPQQVKVIKAAMKVVNYSEAYRIMKYASVHEFVDDGGNKSDYIRNAAEHHTMRK